MILLKNFRVHIYLISSFNVTLKYFSYFELFLAEIEETSLLNIATLFSRKYNNKSPSISLISLVSGIFFAKTKNTIS